MTERLLRLPEVADALSVSVSTVRRLVDRGELPVVHIGRSVRVRNVDVRRFVVARADVRHRPDPRNRQAS